MPNSPVVALSLMIFSEETYNLVLADSARTSGQNFNLTEEVTQELLLIVKTQMPHDKILSHLQNQLTGNFTETEIAQITAFYSSDVGRKISKIMPELTNQSQQFMFECINPILERFFKEHLGFDRAPVFVLEDAPVGGFPAHEHTVYHPGEFIKEYLDAESKTMEKLAAESKLPLDIIKAVCDGKWNITEEIASAFAEPLGRPAHFWLNLQKEFDEAQKKPPTA